MIAIPCQRCEGTDLVRNGHTKAGHQKYFCKTCRFYGTLSDHAEKEAEKHATVEKLHLERVSQRAIARSTGVSRPTIAALLEKRAQTTPPLAQTITPSKERPMLELDAIWSYVGSKAQRIWIWRALERNTQKIVGIAVGDRSETAWERLWDSLPADYRKRAVCSSDNLASYAAVFPRKRYFSVGKETGETAHIARCTTTLRQRCANLVRKTLSFSKNLLLHQIRIRIFIDHYNRTVSV